MNQLFVTKQYTYYVIAKRLLELQYNYISIYRKICTHTLSQKFIIAFYSYNFITKCYSRMSLYNLVHDTTFCHFFQLMTINICHQSQYSMTIRHSHNKYSYNHQALVQWSPHCQKKASKCGLLGSDPTINNFDKNAPYYKTNIHVMTISYCHKLLLHHDKLICYNDKSVCSL